ncbi:MAG: DUF945 family protein [Campylobacterota bacterium]|nr:DUF945 family protein [Campylobacterota bacterium]
MKKILSIAAVLFVALLGYYTIFGSGQVIELLKKQVDAKVQTLQQNGFSIEERRVEDKSEHFVIHYRDPVMISRYLQSQKVDITAEEAEVYRGLKIAMDITYLEGIYSAISADIYPVAFPHSVATEATPQEKKMLTKVIEEKIFLAHIDINKLFTDFKGYLKDIETTFDGEDPLTLVCKGFKFDGSYDDKRLSSSSNEIKRVALQTKSGGKFLLEKLEGEYEIEGKSSYDFKSQYSIKSLLLRDEDEMGVTLDKLAFKSSGEAKKGFASSKFKFELDSIDIKEAKGMHFFEKITSKSSIENISIAAVEKMQKLDSNDTEGFNAAFKEMLAEGITLRVDELSAKKVRDSKSGEMIDGFDINTLVKIDKVTDFKHLEENPFAILEIIDATMHMEFSDKLYLALQKRPELAIAMIILTPVSKDGKMIFDIEYKDGAMKINGKPIL